MATNLGRYEVDRLPDHRFALYYVPPISGQRIEHSTYDDEASAEAARQTHSWRAATFVLTVLQNPYIVQKPHPKQVEFLLLSDMREVLFGGAGGGGKSSALLMAALQYVTEPGYAALILQKTLTNLEKSGALMTRAKEWLHNNQGAVWNKGSNTWNFPSGAKLQFGFIKHENDKYNYKSSDYMCICFEEVTEFKEEDYTYLFSRLRKPKDCPIPIRMRGATNPGGTGHQFIKARFGLNNQGQQNEAAKKTGRVFVQAFATDNPSIDRDDYKKSLSNLTSRERAYMEYGSWEDFKGEFFAPYEWPFWVDLGNAYSIPQGGGGRRIILKGHEVPILVTVDWATDSKKKLDATCFGAAALLPSGNLLMLEVVNRQIRLEHLAAELAAFCRKWNPITVAGENDVLSKAMCNACRQFREIPEVRQIPIRNRDKLMRAQDAILMGENGRIFLPRSVGNSLDTDALEVHDRAYPWVVPFCDQLMSFDGSDNSHDDMVDMLSVMATLSRLLRAGGSGQTSSDYGVFQLTDPRSEM